MIRTFYVSLFTVLLWACNEQQSATTSSTTQQVTTTDTVTAPTPNVDTQQRTSITYRLITSKDSIRKIRKDSSDLKRSVILAVNRMDLDHLVKSDSIIIPNDLSLPILQYAPFPQSLPFLRDVKKIVIFSYPAQYFGAYENGQLVRSGPTNMGRKQYPTSTGLFYTNWKAEKTRSTFNDEWELKWNFNIQNKEGIGWHQYAMPGYPASHSCLRLLEADAKYLYDWADEWVTKGENNVLAQGTPVVIFGSYPFGQQKPWFRLLSDPHALDISVAELQTLITPYLPDIRSQQQKRGQQ